MRSRRTGSIPARISESFGIPQEAINGLKNSQAQPVWILETPEAPVNLVVFEADFSIDSVPIGAQVEFVAPETASVFINGNLVAADMPFDAEMEPLSVYTTITDLPLDLLRSGTNTIRFEVRNQSTYRGMLAEIKIEKYTKE